MEPCLSDQIELFRQRKNFSRAIKKAFENGSEDLIIKCLQDGDVSTIYSELERDPQMSKYIKTLIMRLVYEAITAKAKYSSYESKFCDMEMVESLKDPALTY
jgi:hypothetical protein